MDTDKIKHLYHFTTVENFGKILGGARDGKVAFWATHWGQLNDTLENNYVKSLFKDYTLKKISTKEWAPLVDVIGIKPEKRESFIDRAFEEMSSKVANPYIISFCACDDAIDMWRAYAQDGKGIAFEFNAKKVDAFLQENYKSELLECRYLDKVRDPKGYKTYLKKKGTDLMKATGKQQVNELFREFVTIKHPCYRAEEEVRVVSYDDSAKFTPVPNVKFRAEVLLPLNALEAIIVGPCADTTAESEIAYMLAEAHLKRVKVRRSDLPYRTSPMSKKIDA